MVPLTWSVSLGCKRTFPAAPSPRAPCCQQCPVRDPHPSEMQSIQQACAWRWPQRRLLKAVNSTARSSGMSCGRQPALSQLAQRCFHVVVLFRFRHPFCPLGWTFCLKCKGVVGTKPSSISGPVRAADQPFDATDFKENSWLWSTALPAPTAHPLTHSEPNPIPPT